MLAFSLWAAVAIIVGAIVTVKKATDVGIDQDTVAGVIISYCGTLLGAIGILVAFFGWRIKKELDEEKNNTQVLRDLSRQNVVSTAELALAQNQPVTETQQPAFQLLNTLQAVHQAFIARGESARELWSELSRQQNGARIRYACAFYRMALGDFGDGHDLLILEKWDPSRTRCLPLDIDEESRRPPTALSTERLLLEAAQIVHDSDLHLRRSIASALLRCAAHKRGKDAGTLHPKIMTLCGWPFGQIDVVAGGAGQPMEAVPAAYWSEMLVHLRVGRCEHDVDGRHTAFRKASDTAQKFWATHKDEFVGPNGLPSASGWSAAVVSYAAKSIYWEFVTRNSPNPSAEVDKDDVCKMFDEIGKTACDLLEQGRSEAVFRGEYYQAAVFATVAAYVIAMKLSLDAAVNTGHHKLGTRAVNDGDIVRAINQARAYLAKGRPSIEYKMNGDAVYIYNEVYEQSTLAQEFLESLEWFDAAGRFQEKLWREKCEKEIV